jgi:hypothetical protein
MSMVSDKLITDRNNYVSNRLNKALPYIILAGLMILYTLFGYGVLISNDSVTNIDQITTLNLWSRSSHFSFHLFGIIFYLFFSKLIGLSAVTSVEIMLAVFSAAAGALLYMIVIKKYNNFNQAIITVVIYSLASGVFRFSCQVEYIILVPALGIISLYFYSKGQYLFSGIIFGLGLLTSLFMILFIPIFLLFTSLKELFKKKNIVFAISAVVIFFTVNAFTYHETVSGNWSYGSEIDFYKAAFSEINFLRPAAIYVYGYLRSFNIILFILPFAIYSLYKFNRELLYILIITLIIHLPVAIPEARYGGYQMTAYPIIAISVGYFLIYLRNKQSYIVLSILILYSIINVFIVFSERSFFNDLKETYVQLSHNLDNNSVLIVYQASKPIKNVYAPNLQVIDLMSDYQDKMAQISGYVASDLTGILNNNDTVYILESGVSMPDDKLKLMFSNFTKNQGAKVKGFALDKVLTINSSFHVDKLENYPLDVYKLTKVKIE